MSDKGFIDKIRTARDKAVNDLINELLSNPKFAQALGNAIQKAVAVKSSVDKNLKIFFNALNLPTRDDYKKLLSRVDKLNKSIADLETRIDELLARTEKLAAKADTK